MFIKDSSYIYYNLIFSLFLYWCPRNNLKQKQNRKLSDFDIYQSKITKHFNRNIGRKLCTKLSCTKILDQFWALCTQEPRRSDNLVLDISMIPFQLTQTVRQATGFSFERPCRLLLAKHGLSKLWDLWRYCLLSWTFRYCIAVIG